MKKLIIGNFKMNQTPEESKAYFTKFVAGFNGNRADVVLCPSYLSLPVATFLAKGSPVKLGAQNVSDEEEGSFTGEVSAQMLKNLGVEYVIVGHSDRRNKFKESDRLVNKKIKTAKKQLSDTLNQLYKSEKISKYIDSFKQKICYLSAKDNRRYVETGGLADGFYEIYKVLPEPIKFNWGQIGTHNFLAFESSFIQLRK